MTHLSVIIPLFNEERNIPPLYAKLKAVLERTGKEYEIVLVDDGSTDGTFAAASALYENDPRVSLVRLGKNYGQSMALSAGVDQAAGQVLILMDGDLQHDPEDIPRFLAKIEEGYDVVSGWRKHRVDDVFTRQLPSLVANRIIAKLTGVRLNDFGTTFKAYRREILTSIRLYSNMHRYIPALVSWTGASITEIPIRSAPRNAGKSHYDLFRTFKVVLDILVVEFLLNYLSRPLYIFGKIGAFFTGLGLLTIAVLSVGWAFFGLNMNHNRGTLLLGALCIVAGLQFFGTGLVSEVIARTYYESQGKRPYFVRMVKSHR